jgi:hypothetical protein
MWSPLLVPPAPDAATAAPAGRAARGGLVLAMRAGRSVEAAAERLRRLAASPALEPAVRRIVVVTAEPLPAVPPARVRVVHQVGPGRAAAVARLLHEAAAAADAAAVLLLDERADVDPDLLVDALARCAGTDAFDVVALHAAGERETVLAALLPLDAVRAVGSASPELEDAVVADLVRRADAAGFRALAVPAAADRAARCAPEERLLLALLHEPVRARDAQLRRALAEDLLDLLALRTAEVARRHAALRGLLAGVPAEPADAGAPASGVRGLLAAQRRSRALLGASAVLAARLWWAWPTLRRRVRRGAFDRAAPEAWAVRVPSAAWMNDAFRTRERLGTPAGAERLRWRPWSTRRGTSAA